MRATLITLLILLSITLFGQTKGDIVQVFMVKDTGLTDKLNFKITKGNTYQAFCFGMPVKGKQPEDTTGVLRISNPKAFKKKQKYLLTIKISNARTGETYQMISMEIATVWKP